MRATAIRPAQLRPGSMLRPSFGSPTATVVSASTATPSTRPVSAQSPEGRSTATTRIAPDPFARAAFMDGKKEWNPELDGVLGEVGATGHSPFDWAQLKQLLSAKLEAVRAPSALTPGPW